MQSIGNMTLLYAMLVWFGLRYKENACQMLVCQADKTTARLNCHLIEKRMTRGTELVSFRLWCVSV